MYGNDWPGPTASGVSTGKMSRSHTWRSSSCSSRSSSAIWVTTIRSAASAGRRSSFQMRDCRSLSSSARSCASASACRGVRPSGDCVDTPADASPIRPATRTMKNSSSINEKIEQNLTRSSSGSVGSAASSSTRASYSRNDSSRFSSRSGRGTGRRFREDAGGLPSRTAVERLRAIASGRRCPEALEQQAVPQPAVAHRQRLLAELLQHRADDARAGEDDLGALRLEADDLAPLVGGACPVELDLAVDLAAVEHRPLYDVRVVDR